MFARSKRALVVAGLAALIGSGAATVGNTQAQPMDFCERLPNHWKCQDQNAAAAGAVDDGSSAYDSSVNTAQQTQTTDSSSSTEQTTTTSEPTSQPTSEPTAQPTSEPTAQPTSEPSTTSCAATITPTGGLPWRPGGCDAPAYANHVIPASPVLDGGETSKVRSLSGSMLNIDEYSEPIYYATAKVALRPVKCVTYGCVGGSSAPVVGDEHVAPGTDGQLIIVDTERRKSYEFYQTSRDGDGTVKINGDGSVTVGSMSVVDLDGRGNKTAGGQNLNITGAGVSRLFGVIRAHEVRAAASDPRTAIKHALSVSLPVSFNCAGKWREPATKTDGRSSASDCVIQGGRYQMDPGFDCSTVGTKMGRAVCYALQKYGAYNMDNNGSDKMVFYGQHRRSWPTADSDYAAVGVSGDYSGLGIPMNRLRVLSSWSGR